MNYNISINMFINHNLLTSGVIENDLVENTIYSRVLDSGYAARAANLLAYRQVSIVNTCRITNKESDWHENDHPHDI